MSSNIDISGSGHVQRMYRLILAARKHRNNEGFVHMSYLTQMQKLLEETVRFHLADMIERDHTIDEFVAKFEQSESMQECMHDTQQAHYHATLVENERLQVQVAELTNQLNRARSEVLHYSQYSRELNAAFRCETPSLACNEVPDTESPIKQDDVFYDR